MQGKKRTAYAMLEWFLNVNGLGSSCAQDDEVVGFCLAAENEKWPIERIEKWLRLNVAH